MMGKEKIYKDLDVFEEIFNEEYQRFKDSHTYLSERRIIGWDMVAEENHSVNFDDLELNQKFLLKAQNLNANHLKDPTK